MQTDLIESQREQDARNAERWHMLCSLIDSGEYLRQIMLAKPHELREFTSLKLTKLVDLHRGLS